MSAPQTHNHELTKPAASGQRTLATVWVLIVVCVAVEALLQLGDLGWITAPRLRATAYEYFGFWPGLLGNWRPNYTVQPQLMFVTHAFLHGGLLHLALNMVTLWSLGRAVIARVGQARFALIYFVSMLGGATGFWLLTETMHPMVGASGALFGLAGALVSWNYLDRYLLDQGLLPVLQTVLFLVFLNIVLWWAMGGQLAWQTHLGGFVAGWVIAMLVDPRGRPLRGT
ncbi:rhomboid family intramembrane serine protease [Tropicimonas sp. S265A]|uniref:rhomboid family intramembrane serine protease n=1 Tax=Tropicimonas sp. S265A TaxID=3415134 RepID=UPI003C7A3DE1